MPKKTQQYRIAYQFPSGLCGVTFVEGVDEDDAKAAFKCSYPNATIEFCRTEADREFHAITFFDTKGKKP